MHNKHGGKSVIGIACGGTGGHFFPGMALGKRFLEQGYKVILLIGGHRLGEQISIATEMGFQCVEVPAERYPNSFWQRIKFFLRLLIYIYRCGKILHQHQVKVLIGMGSWASVPICLATLLTGTQLVLHEGNFHMGQANRLLARFAKLIGYTFPGTKIPSTHAKTLLVGMPLRENIYEAANLSVEEIQKRRQEFCYQHGFQPQYPILLIFGGSQGSQIINETVEKMLPIIHQRRYPWQFIHLTGSSDNYHLREVYQTYYLPAIIERSNPNIHLYYQAADLVICRAGASSLYELAAFRKPAILIPFALAKESHQESNARFLEKKEAAIVISEAELNPYLLCEQICRLLDNKEHLHRLSCNMGSFFYAHGIDAFCESIETLN